MLGAVCHVVWLFAKGEGFTCLLFAGDEVLGSSRVVRDCCERKGREISGAAGRFARG